MSKLLPTYDSLREIHIHLLDINNLIAPQPRINSIHSGNVKGIMLSPQMAQQAILEAIPLGLQSVRLGGPQTLQYPDLDKLLDTIESHELEITIETNGMGLSTKQLDRLAKLPQCTICVGLNGANRSTHDHYYQPGAFDVAVKAIRSFSNTGIPVRVIYSIRRRNFHQLASAAQLVEELGGNSIYFNLPQPASGKAYNDQDHLHVEELIALGWRVERDLASTAQIPLAFDQPPAFRGLHPKARVTGQDRFGILNSLSVTKFGEFTLFGVSQGMAGLVLGKVKEDKLSDIWRYHPTLTLLREGLPDRLEGVCERCTMKSICLGDCPVNNYLRTGSFWSPGWFCEAAENVGLFPAGRLLENIKGKSCIRKWRMCAIF